MDRRNNCRFGEGRPSASEAHGDQPPARNSIERLRAEIAQQGIDAVRALVQRAALQDALGVE